MSVEERILTCRLLEKMKVYEVYGKRLGLKDISQMHGKQIDKGAGSLAEKG